MVLAINLQRPCRQRVRNNLTCIVCHSNNRKKIEGPTIWVIGAINKAHVFWRGLVKISGC